MGPRGTELDLADDLRAAARAQRSGHGLGVFRCADLVDAQDTGAEERFAEHRLLRQLLRRNHHRQARLAGLQQQVDQLDGFAERGELVEDDQAGVRRLRPQAGVRELLEVLDQHPTDQRHVFRGRRRRQTEIRDSRRPQAVGEVEGVRSDGRSHGPNTPYRKERKRPTSPESALRCKGSWSIAINSALIAMSASRRARPPDALRRG